MDKKGLTHSCLTRPRVLSGHRISQSGIVLTEQPAGPTSPVDGYLKPTQSSFLMVFVLRDHTGADVKTTAVFLTGLKQ